MKQLFSFLCLTVALTAHAQKQKTEVYIDNYKEIAITEMMRTGVPAAITLAQGILESQSGESDLVKNSNNHFGIKCKTEWTGDRTYHDDDARGECFRVYPTATESYKDHSDFLKTRPNYAFLFQLDPTDFEGWARGLKKAGYATSPSYPQRLLKLINDYNLQQYSLEAMARLKDGPQQETQAVLTVTAKNTTNNPAAETLTEPLTRTKTADDQAVQPAGEATTAPVIKKISYPQGIFTINHTKVVYASAGTSLLSLANRYDLPLVKLVDYNDLKEMDVLDNDRLMFIEKKQKKGATDFHTVADGETLHDICQLEGIRMEYLLDYNASLNKDSRVLKGDKIYLRTVTTSASARTSRSSQKKG